VRARGDEWRVQQISYCTSLRTQPSGDDAYNQQRRRERPQQRQPFM